MILGILLGWLPAKMTGRSYEALIDFALSELAKPPIPGKLASDRAFAERLAQEGFRMAFERKGKHPSTLQLANAVEEICAAVRSFVGTGHSELPGVNSIVSYWQGKGGNSFRFEARQK